MTDGVEGKRFYPPGVIAAYCVVFLPIGLLIYGLNVRRRGGRAIGGIMSALSAALFVLIVIFVGVYGRSPGSFGILGVFVGIGLLRMEDGPYRSARARGGAKAAWWPPLLWALGCVLATPFIAALF